MCEESCGDFLRRIVLAIFAKEFLNSFSVARAVLCVLQAVQSLEISFELPKG